jgi:hypothetical protein
MGKDGSPDSIPLQSRPTAAVSERRGCDLGSM